MRVYKLGIIELIIVIYYKIGMIIFWYKILLTNYIFLVLFFLWHWMYHAYYVTYKNFMRALHKISRVTLGQACTQQSLNSLGETQAFFVMILHRKSVWPVAVSININRLESLPTSWMQMRSRWNMVFLLVIARRNNLM